MTVSKEETSIPNSGELEEWKSIVGFEYTYEVSNIGRVRSLHYAKTRILKFADARGYKTVNLCKTPIDKNMLVHRLVLEAFKPNSNKLFTHVNHIDGNKTNNRLNNLEWVTAKENTEHAYRTGLFDNKGEKSYSSKLKAEDVIYLRQLPKEDYAKLAAKFNVHKNTIFQAINGITWKNL